MRENTPYESHEYDRLVDRKFKPYSIGHQRMYTKAIDVLRTEGKQVRVFEAGFGIGFGLTKMVESGMLKDYMGVEPNVKSFNYVKGLGYDELATLLNEPFSQELADRVCSKDPGDIHCEFDEAFCIEVIEHVPMEQHLEFLIALRQMAPRLWFSSPCKTKSREGVRSVKEWTTMLRQARFETVDVDVSEWTYLYQCR